MPPLPQQSWRKSSWTGSAPTACFLEPIVFCAACSPITSFSSLVQRTLFIAPRSRRRACRHGNVITGSVYDQAWGATCPRPQYKFDSKPHVTKVRGSGDGSSSAASECLAQVHGKFYWPNQTNAEARIPVEIKQVAPRAATAACVEESRCRCKFHF